MLAGWLAAEAPSLSLGQGCQSDPSKAAQLFTDLAMQAHPYAQVSHTVLHVVMAAL